MIYRAALMLGPLFPVHTVTKHGRCSCGNPKCHSPGKHPTTVNGCYDATEDEQQIAAWLAAGRNVGLHTSRVFVLDEDPRSGGDVELAKLEAEYGKLPETPVAFTGGGGRHYFFELPSPDLRWNAKVAGTSGLDVKAGPGCLVVSPPSVHASGRAYVWDVSPEHVSPAPLPSWLLRRCVKMVVDREIGPATGAAAASMLSHCFRLVGAVKHTIDELRIAVACPWEHEHSTRGGSLTSTVIFAPTADRPMGHFHCSHAHCIGRRTADVIASFEPEIVHQAAALVMAACVSEEPPPTMPPGGGEPCPIEAAYVAAEREAIQWESAGCPAVWPRAA